MVAISHARMRMLTAFTQVVWIWAYVAGAKGAWPRYRMLCTLILGAWGRLSPGVAAWPQEDSWAVITSYFEEKGLVRQQLESFDEFINSQMQEIVDENDEHVVTPQQQVPPPLPRPQGSPALPRPQAGLPPVCHCDGNCGLLRTHAVHETAIARRPPRLKLPCVPLAEERRPMVFGQAQQWSR